MLPLCKVISRHLHISTNYILHIYYGRNSKIAIQTLSKPLWRPVLHQSRSHSQSLPLNVQTTSQFYREHFIFLPTRTHTHLPVRACCIRAYTQSSRWLHNWIFLAFYWTVVIIHNISIYIQEFSISPRASTCYVQLFLRSNKGSCPEYQSSTWLVRFKLCFLLLWCTEIFVLHSDLKTWPCR